MVSKQHYLKCENWKALSSMTSLPSEAKQSRWEVHETRSRGTTTNFMRNDHDKLTQ